jgi:hypothetical protein
MVNMKKAHQVMIFLLLVSLCTDSLAAQNYYVDSVNGQDNDSGSSAGQPWQSLEKVNSVIFQPGYVVYFKAGTRYRGQLKPQGSGNLNAGLANSVKVDMYGDGAKPCIEAGGKYQALCICTMWNTGTFKTWKSPIKAIRVSPFERYADDNTLQESETSHFCTRPNKATF